MNQSPPTSMSIANSEAWSAIASFNTEKDKLDKAMEAVPFHLKTEAISIMREARFALQHLVQNDENARKPIEHISVAQILVPKAG